MNDATTSATSDIAAQAAVEQVCDYGKFHIQFANGDLAALAVKAKEMLEAAGFEILPYSTTETMNTSAAWADFGGTVYCLTDVQPHFDDASPTGASFGPGNVVPTLAFNAVKVSIYQTWDFGSSPDGKDWAMDGTWPEAINENNKPIAEPIFRTLNEALDAVTRLRNFL